MKEGSKWVASKKKVSGTKKELGGEQLEGARRKKLVSESSSQRK